MSKHYPVNAFRLCVDSVQEDIKGYIFSPLQAEKIAFSGLGEALVKMDELFDKCGYPQAFQDKRSFQADRNRQNLYKGTPGREQDTDFIVGQNGKKSTFDIVVRTRQNTSWQGTLYAGSGEILMEFDGEMELLSGIMKWINIA